MPNQQQEIINESRARTSYAQVRTALALERTFNSWFKTCLGLYAGGLGIIKIFQDTRQATLAVMGGAMMMLMSIMIAFYAAHRYRQGAATVKGDPVSPCPSWMVIVLVFGFAVVATFGIYVAVLI